MITFINIETEEFKRYGAGQSLINNLHDGIELQKQMV